jgi:EmrB/QacA subfamily drug resistance transporter
MTSSLATPPATDQLTTVTPRPTPAPAATRAPAVGWGMPLAVLIVGMFMSILDTSIVNVAIPTMQNDFGATPQDIQWISTAYTLCLGVVVPASAWLGDRVGLKRLYLISLVAFSMASALCGLAGGLNSMIIFRILQAIPGGIIPVTCLTALYRVVPKEKIGTAMGLYGLGLVVAPAVGPTLGGYLVEYVSWRLIFFINVPIGILGAAAALAVLPTFAKPASRALDVPGFATIATGLFALLLAVSKGPDWGWTGYRVLMLFTVAALSLALFVVTELQVSEPLLDLRVFRYRPFVNSLLLISIVSIGLFATVFYVPLFLQEGQQLPAFDTGLLLLPQALVMLVCMPIAGRLYDRIGPRVPAVTGLAICAAGLWLLRGISADMTHTEVIWWLMVMALGIGLAMMPIMTGGLSTLPAEMINSGSALNNVVQRVSQAIGLAGLTALATTLQAQDLADRSGLLNSFTTDPRATALQRQGPLGLYPLWQRTNLEVLASAYSNIFLIITILLLVAALLALFLRHGPATTDSADRSTVATA